MLRSIVLDRFLMFTSHTSSRHRPVVRHLSTLLSSLLRRVSAPRYRHPLPALSTTRRRNMSSLPRSVGNFELIVEEQLEFAKDIRIAKWRSKETGLKVVWADVEGPLVQGYFSVITEVRLASCLYCGVVDLIALIRSSMTQVGPIRWNT
jgi:hypothetical protein